MTSTGRFQRIAAFAREAGTAVDAFKLAVAGFARSRPFDGEDWISKMGRALFPKLAVRPRVLKGMQIEINPADLGHLISFEEIFVERTYDLGRLPFVPDTIVDCGAHAGFFTVLAAAAFPAAKLHAFEPNPRNLETLRRQAELNSISVEIVAAAASTEEGNRSFAAEYSNTGALVNGGGRGFQVRTVDMAEWLRRLRTTALLLKMDIEGEEERVLPRLIGLLPARSAVFLESHRGDAGWNAMAGMMKAANMETSRIRDRGQFIDGFAVRS